MTDNYFPSAMVMHKQVGKCRETFNKCKSRRFDNRFGFEACLPSVKTARVRYVKVSVPSSYTWVLKCKTTW